MVDPATSRREAALALADELLADIELSQLYPGEIARKAFRLARLLDDQAAMGWLRFEVIGYPSGDSLPQDAWAAAVRSNRVYVDFTKRTVADTSMLGEMETT